jgi:hypothetical protein
MRDDFDFHRNVFRGKNPNPIVLGSAAKALKILARTIVIMGVAAWFLIMRGEPKEHGIPKQRIRVGKTYKVVPSPTPATSPDPFHEIDEKFDRHWEIP